MMSPRIIEGKWYVVVADVLRGPFDTQDEALAARAKPQCPKHCEVSTPAEPAGRLGRFVCSGCGHEFSWPSVG